MLAFARYVTRDLGQADITRILESVHRNQQRASSEMSFGFSTKRKFAQRMGRSELVGGIARGIGARLTALYSRSLEASWIVNAGSGMPSGYAASERHPAQLNKREIISRGRELEQRMVRWESAR
jgi:hypothetical protein